MTGRKLPLRQPLTDSVDLLLADVVIRVQLSRTDYRAPLRIGELPEDIV